MFLKNIDAIKECKIATNVITLIDEIFKKSGIIYIER